MTDPMPYLQQWRETTPNGWQRVDEHGRQVKIRLNSRYVYAGIYAPDGGRIASARCASVDAAKAFADDWLAANGPGVSP